MRHATMTTLFSAAVTAAFTLAGAGSPGPTAPGTPAEPAGTLPQAATQVPFKGTFDGVGVAADVPGDRCAVLTVHIQGPGTATHLGRLTTDQSHCASPTSLEFTDGEFTLTAANGDLLRGTYFGEFVLLEPPLFRIDGHASGVQNLATGEATVTLIGTISSVGSRKGR